MLDGNPETSLSNGTIPMAPGAGGLGKKINGMGRVAKVSYSILAYRGALLLRNLGYLKLVLYPPEQMGNIL